VAARFTCSPGGPFTSPVTPGGGPSAPFPGSCCCWAPALCSPLRLTRCRFWELVRSLPCGAQLPLFPATPTFILGLRSPYSKGLQGHLWFP
jgi:hypothetical protein